MILVGRKSASDAFEEFKLFNSFYMPRTANNMSEVNETRLSSISGRSSYGFLVNYNVYRLFRASVFSLESLMITLEGPRLGMLLSSAFCLI